MIRKSDSIRTRQRGAILVLVLWLVLILSLIALSYSTSVRTSLNIVTNRTNKVKARYYAKAGIERTIVELLQLQEGYYGELSGFYNDEIRFFEQPVGDGVYTLATGKRDESGRMIYGITDEASRVNLNTVTEEALYTFPELTPEMINAFLDWRDSDSETRPDGAEDDYYQMLEDPYYCKNGGLHTVMELLLIAGWTSVEVFGEDANRNGLLDPNEDDGDYSPPYDDQDGELDKGLADFFTVYSYDREINPDGQMRLDLNTASESELRQIEGMTQTQAAAIVAWRNQRRFTSLAELLDVTEAQTQGQSGGQGSTALRSSALKQSSVKGTKLSISQGKQTQSRDSLRKSGISSSGAQTQGTRVFNFDQVARMVDWLCVGTENKHNRININTAPFEVLMTLPGMTEDVANEILTRRASSQGPFTSRSELRDINGMTESLFANIIDYVTVQSYQFRIIAEGREGETKATIEAVVDIATDPPTILYWRES